MDSYFLTPGKYTVTISYEGDNNFNASENSKDFIVTDFNFSSFTLLNRVISESNLSVINLNDDILKDISEFNSFKNGISIKKNIIINGNGHTIDANYNGKIFNIYTTGNLTIFNCTFINSVDRVIDADGTLIVDNCSFINCSGIYSRKSLNIISSSFINCSSYSGGAIGNSGKLFVYGCSFINCSANNYGGAIYIYSPKDMNISFNSFINCLDKDFSPVYSTKGEFEYNWWGTNNPTWSFAKIGLLCQQIIIYQIKLEIKIS